MRPNKVKELWRSGKPAAVAWMGTADTYIAEMMGTLGFDAVVLDMQHGMGIGPDRAAAWLQAVSATGTMPMVRVPWNEPVVIQWVLDAGSYGVIIPMVNTPQDAVRAAGACRYPPMGYRSFGPNRAQYFSGVSAAEYFEHANREVICLAMIEEKGAVAHLEEMAEVPGIDGFYIGPVDMAISMGLPASISVKDERHTAACRKVVDVARAKGLVAGIHTASPEDALRRFDEGFMFCPLLSDTGILRAGARAALETVRRARTAR